MAYRSGTKVDYALTSATPSIAVPSGAASNDIAIIDIWTESGTAVTTPPSGFAYDTGVQTGAGRVFWLRRYWKRLTGSDTGSYSFTLASSDSCMLVCTLWTGRVTSGSPFDVASFAGVTPSAYTLTTVTAGCDLLTGIGTWDNSWSTSYLPSTYSARSPADYVWSFGKDNVSAGANSGAPASTPSDNYAGVFSALKPDTGGGTPAPANSILIYRPALIRAAYH